MCQAKVYCINCRYFSGIGRFRRDNTTYECIHPNNTVFIDSWLEQKLIYQKTPQEMNCNNDCKLFAELEPPGCE